MSRISAKILTTLGFIICGVSFAFFVINLKTLTSFSAFLFSFLFVAGIILILASFAFYTEI